MGAAPKSGILYHKQDVVAHFLINMYSSGLGKILKVCKALLLLKRYWEALEVVHHVLRIGSHLGKVKCDELRALGARMSISTNHFLILLMVSYLVHGIL